MSLSLYEISSKYQGLFSALSNGEEISEEQLKDINELEDSLENKAVSIASLIKNMEAEQKAIVDAQKEMWQREFRLSKKIDNLKGYLKSHLISCGVKEIKSSPYFQIKLKSCPEKVVINAESKVPDEFVRTKVTVEADKTKIKEHIKAGNPCDFAHLEMDVRLEIK